MSLTTFAADIVTLNVGECQSWTYQPEDVAAGELRLLTALVRTSVSRAIMAGTSKHFAVESGVFLANRKPVAMLMITRLEDDRDH